MIFAYLCPWRSWKRCDTVSLAGLLYSDTYRIYETSFIYYFLSYICRSDPRHMIYTYLAEQNSQARSRASSDICVCASSSKTTVEFFARDLRSASYMLKRYRKTTPLVKKSPMVQSRRIITSRVHSQPTPSITTKVGGKDLLRF